MRQQTTFESKALKRASYDDTSRTLTIEFSDRTIGEYQEVPPEIYAALLNARSKGQFLNAMIRGCFEYRQRTQSFLS